MCTHDWLSTSVVGATIWPIKLPPATLCQYTAEWSKIMWPPPPHTGQWIQRVCVCVCVWVGGGGGGQDAFRSHSPLISCFFKCITQVHDKIEFNYFHAIKQMEHYSHKTAKSHITDSNLNKSCFTTKSHTFIFKYKQQSQNQTNFWHKLLNVTVNEYMYFILSLMKTIIDQYLIVTSLKPQFSLARGSLNEWTSTGIVR